MIKNWIGAWWWFITNAFYYMALYISVPKVRTNYWAYFKTVNRHRWYVFQEARKLGIPFLGFIHDWSKYLPSEFVPYAKYFNGGYARGEQPEDVKLAFDFAWLHHQRWNKHHWQSYVLHNDNAECPKWEVKRSASHVTAYRHSTVEIDGVPLYIIDSAGRFDLIFDLAQEMSRLPKALPMPDRYRREMVADWRGAGRAYGNDDTRGWYLKNKSGIILHTETRVWVERELGVIEFHEVSDEEFKQASKEVMEEMRDGLNYLKDK